MLNTHTLWTLAVAEMRSCRRLLRSWIIFGIALTFCVGWYVNNIESNLFPGSPSSWIHHQINPRYTVAEMMSVIVTTFSFGLIFLVFDIRARDVQNRTHEIVDSLPANNFEIILGRLIGVLLLLLILILFFIGALTCYEATTELVGSPYRVGIQPLSLATLLIWSIVPNLVFFSALIACLSILVRNRLVVAIIAVSAVSGTLWVEDQVPVYLQQILSPFVGNVLLPTDLTPVFVTPAIAVSRFAIFLVSIALLLCAAALLPRTEPRRKMLVRLSIAMSSIGVLTVLGLLATVQGTANLREGWASVHRQHALVEFPDIQHLQGSIDIRPGHRVSLDVTLSVRTPDSNTTDSVVFSLNPGYKIQRLFVDDEETTNFSFRAGLLKLPVEVFPADSHKVRVVATGRPDDRFAYLDQTRDFQQLANENVSRLGLRSFIFHTDYVALMPGIAWYPISGVITDRENLEQLPRDLFTSDLTVNVPRKWQVAMAGAREKVASQKRNSFQFKTDAPLPELALLAAEFEHRSATIEGIGFEVFFSKTHSKNLDLLTPIVDDIQQWISSRIKNAASLSLQFPYKQFYVVEVPSSLRIFRGGWRMRTSLHPPGMMLVRETTLPTLNIESLVRLDQGQRFKTPEGQYNPKFRYLWKYISDDLQGGNPFADVSRNFVSNQISATGRGATALQYLLDQLSNQLIVGHESCFVVSVSDFGEYIGIYSWGRLWSEYRFSDAATQERIKISGLPSTRNLMDRMALFNLPFQTDPITSYRVLLSKGHALARSMIDYYGEEKIGAFLTTLRTEFEEQSFTVEEFLDTASLVDLDLNDWVLPWLEDTKLPGYLVTPAKVTQSPNPSLGKAQYQTAFVLHNAEPIPGYVRVVWSEYEHRHYWHIFGDFTYSDPLFLEEHQSIRIAIQSNNPLTGLRIEPVLALNRMPIDVFLPTDYESTEVHSVDFPFITEVSWQPPETTAIIVDDLDPGFSIISLAANSEAFSFTQTRLHASDEESEFDHGLLARSYPQPRVWHRLYNSASYGYYRRTFARVVHGDQTSAARFAVNLPQEGHWKLEFFVPPPVFQTPAYGSWIDFFGLILDDNSSTNRRADPNAVNEYYRLEIMDGFSRWKQKFDIGNATEGWNEIGKFELRSTEVEVLLSDYAGHKDIMVHADAIRWTPESPD